MNILRQKFQDNPVLARVLPFGIFLALTFCQGQFGEASRYWFYLAKILAGAWLVWEMRSAVREMRWAFSWEAVTVGITVFIAWVALDPFYKKLGSSSMPWNPHVQFNGSPLAWLFIVVRTLGSTLIVPPLEEVFYRSFIYRYITKPDFQSVPLNRFAWLPFLATAALFGFAHHEWLAGILCAFAYQALVLRKNRLGDAMTAHAITNLLLGIWVVWRGAWNFW